MKAFKPQVLAAAERESRRMLREAEREARGVSVQLLVLEDLGAELREHVRRRRRELPAVPAVEAPAAPPAPRQLPARGARAVSLAGRPRHGRARMRDSPLAELFRATD